MAETIRLGVVGCGGFGLFALQHFAQVPEVVLVAMAGTHREAAQAAARRFGLPDIQEVDALLDRDDVDLVYIATPPFLHYTQSLAALEAGKHVVCEKPLALQPEEAEHLLEVADARGLLVVADLIQRYNPLAEAVGKLVRAEVLGAPLHGYFENYASDEGLGPRHWFWDREQSGGIFVEHGVHFFDLFAGWLGSGEVVEAQRVSRPGSGVEEQVRCTVRYRDDVLVCFYHGFTQPERMDRQELRLLFERGDVTLHEWVPTRATIRAIADEAETRKLTEIFPGARLDVTEVYHGPARYCRGRQKELDVFQRLELHVGDERKKMHVYGDLLRALLADQLAWVRDRSHRRRITGRNGVESVRMARAADRLAVASSPLASR